MTCSQGIKTLLKTKVKSLSNDGLRQIFAWINGKAMLGEDSAEMTDEQARQFVEDLCQEMPNSPNPQIKNLSEDTKILIQNAMQSDEGVALIKTLCGCHRQSAA